MFGPGKFDRAGARADHSSLFVHKYRTSPSVRIKTSPLPLHCSPLVTSADPSPSPEYEGAAKTKFTFVFWGGMTFAFAVPFIACAYQINKAEAS